MARKNNTKAKYETGARLGFEEKLWAAADKMRSYMDPAEYKHVVLRLISTKYTSPTPSRKSITNFRSFRQTRRATGM